VTHREDIAYLWSVYPFSYWWRSVLQGRRIDAVLRERKRANNRKALYLTLTDRYGMEIHYMFDSPADLVTVAAREKEVHLGNSASARIVIYVFTDSLCSHCRNVSMKMRHLYFEFSVDSISFARSI
jgi:hypothetical protein